MKRFLQLIPVLAALAWCAPAHAAVSTTQAPASQDCTTGTACLKTVTSTGAGHLITVSAVDEAGGTISSCCNAGCVAAYVGTTQATNTGASRIFYCLSSASGATSIGPTWTTTANAGAHHITSVKEFSTDTTGFVLNSGATPSCTSTGTSANQAWCALTVSAVNGVVVGVTYDGATASAVNQSYTGTFVNGDGEAYKINLTSYVAPAWTATSAAWAEVVLAIQEIPAAGGTTPQRTLMGVGR